MLVSTKHKKLIINARFPERITTVIPTARIFEYKDHPLVAVPHRLDEVRVLRNIGFPAPSPIAHYYGWSGQYTPFNHQRVTAEFATINRRAFILNQVGSGKSLSVLWAIDYLMAIGEIRKVLVVTPLSTLDRVWGDEIFRHFTHLDTVVLHGSAERRRKLLAQDAHIYVINHDGVEVLLKELQDRTDIDCVVIDELAEYRNANTDRWRAVHALIKDRKYVWGMTGTPTPKSPMDAWAQCRLIAPDRVPKYAGKFKDMVMRQVTTFKWMARPEAAHIVKEAMQPAILFTRDECLDLPPCTFSTREVQLSSEQTKAYKEMLTRLRTEYESGEVTAVNEAVKAMKLIQIAAGCAYDGDGENVVYPPGSRLTELKSCIEQAEGKIIVYVPLTGALNLVAADLRAKGYTVAVVHGQTSKSERNAIFADFQNEAGATEVLVAHPKCMAHGLTLTSASVIVWYIPTNDFSIYEQACGRIVRQGQKRHQHIIHLEGSAIERRMYQRLEQRGNAQGVLLDLIKQEMDTPTI